MKGLPAAAGTSLSLTVKLGVFGFINSLSLPPLAESLLWKTLALSLLWLAGINPTRKVKQGGIGRDFGKTSCLHDMTVLDGGCRKRDKALGVKGPHPALWQCH